MITSIPFAILLFLLVQFTEKINTSGGVESPKSRKRNKEEPKDQDVKLLKNAYHNALPRMEKDAIRKLHETAIMFHYKKLSFELVKTFNIEGYNEHFVTFMTELQKTHILLSLILTKKEASLSEQACVYYKFLKRLARSELLNMEDSWKLHFYKGIWHFKWAEITDEQTASLEKKLNIKKQECSTEEIKHSAKYLLEMPAFTELSHFWSLRWLIKNSPQFDQYLLYHPDDDLRSSLKGKLFSLLGPVAFDRLELYAGETLKLDEPLPAFYEYGYKKFLLAKTPIARKRIELRMAINQIFMNLAKFSNEIDNKADSSKNFDFYDDLFAKLEVIRIYQLEALQMIDDIGMGEIIEVKMLAKCITILLRIKGVKMFFGKSKLSSKDLHDAFNDFGQQGGDDLIDCSEKEIDDVFEIQRKLNYNWHMLTIETSIRNDPELQELAKEKVGSIYWISQLVGGTEYVRQIWEAIPDKFRDAKYFVDDIDLLISKFARDYLTNFENPEKKDMHKSSLIIFLFMNWIEQHINKNRLRTPFRYVLEQWRCEFRADFDESIIVPGRRSDLCKKHLLLSSKLMEFVQGIGANRDPNSVQMDYIEIKNAVMGKMSKSNVNKNMTFHVDLQKHFIFLLDKIAKNEKGKPKKKDELNFWDFFRDLDQNNENIKKIQTLLDFDYLKKLYEMLNLKFNEEKFAKGKKAERLHSIGDREKSSSKRKKNKPSKQSDSNIKMDKKKSEDNERKKSCDTDKRKSGSRGTGRKKSSDSGKKRSSSRGREGRKSSHAEKKRSGSRGRRRSKSAGGDKRSSSIGKEGRKSADTRGLKSREEIKSSQADKRKSSSKNSESKISSSAEKDKKTRDTRSSRRSKSADVGKRKSASRGIEGRKSMDLHRKKGGSDGKGRGSSEEKRKRSESSKRESRDLEKRARSKSQEYKRSKSRGISSSPKVADVGSPSQFRHNINLLFNMPSTRVRNELCDKYGYQNVSNKTQYSSDFTFATDEYEPGEVVDIKGDGNCGYRSLSYILTGTQDNHVKIRKDILEYLEKALFANKDWCGVYGLEGLEKHIKVAKEPSKGPDENEKWMSNIDILAAAKLFNMNIIVCEPNQGTYRWHIHSPNLTGNFDGSEQDVHKPSVFIYNTPGHFEVIKSPQKKRRERKQTSTKRSGRVERADSEERGRKSSGSRRLTKSSGRKERPSKREKSGDRNKERRSSKDRQRDASRGRKSSGRERSSKRESSNERKRTSSSKGTPSSDRKKHIIERISSKDHQKDDLQRRKPSKGEVVKSGSRRHSRERKDKSGGRKESKARSSSRERKGTRRRSSSSKSSGKVASGHSMSVERRGNPAKMGKFIIEEIGKSNLKACRSKKGLFEYYGKFVENPNEIVQQMCDFCVYINQIEKQIKQGEIILKKLRNNLWKINQKRLDTVKIEWNEMVGRNFGPIGANPQELEEKLHAVLRELNEILFGRKVSPAESMAVEIADILGQLHVNKFSHFLSLDKGAKSSWDSKPESIRQLALFNFIQSIGDWKASEKTLKSYKKRMDRFNERIASWKKFSEQADLDSQLRAQYKVKKENFVAKKSHNWQQIQFGNEEKTTDSKLTTQLQDEIKFVDIFGEEKGDRREIQWAIIFKNAYKSVKEIVVDWNKEAELMEYGSYMIGALTVSSDVDAICVLPEAAKLDSFFGESICNILESLDKRRRPVRTRNCDDQSLYCKFCKNDNIIKVVKIPGARIPIIKLEYCADKDAHKIFLDKCQDRVDFDLQFAAVPFAAKSNGKSKYDIDGHIRELKGKLLDSDEKQVTLRSLEGLKQNELILESLPKNAKNFRLSISAIKHWAKKYHIYSPIYGYLKGIGLTIMMAKIFALFPTATVPFLLEMFFFIFITWPWQMPVQLLPVANNTPAGPKWELEAKSLRANWYSRFRLPTNIVMPIVAPDPEDDVFSNMTESGKEIVMESMQEGLRRIREVRESGGHWGRFMDGIDIGRNYQHFLVINCATRGSDEEIAEDFCEYVNSKLRMQMTLDVVNNRLNSSNIRTAHIFTTKKAQNHRCVIPGDNFAHFQGYFCKLWLVGLKYFDNAPMSPFAFSRFENKLAHEDQLLFKSYAGILLRKSLAKHQWFLDRQRDYFVHTRYLTLNQLKEWGITLHGSRIDIS